MLYNRTYEKTIILYYFSQDFVKDCNIIGRDCTIPGKGNNGCFGKTRLLFDMIALRCIP